MRQSILVKTVNLHESFPPERLSWPFTPLNLGISLSSLTICMGLFVTLTLLSNGFCTIKAWWRWTHYVSEIYGAHMVWCWQKAVLKLARNAGAPALQPTEKQSSSSAVGSGTEQRPLSGSCAKRAGRPPTVSQVKHRSERLASRLVVQRLKTWRLYPGCSLWDASLFYQFSFHCNLLGFFTCKMEAPLECKPNFSYATSLCWVWFLPVSAASHPARRDLGSLPPLRCSDVKAAFPSRIFVQAVASSSMKFTHSLRGSQGGLCIFFHGPG